MSIGSILKTRIGTETLAGARIYPLVCPQGSAFPRVDYAIEEQRVQTLGEVTGTRGGTIVLRAWDTNYDSAGELAGELLDQLLGSSAGFTVLDQGTTDVIEERTAQQKPFYGRVLTLSFWLEE